MICELETKTMSESKTVGGITWHTFLVKWAGHAAGYVVVGQREEMTYAAIRLLGDTDEDKMTEAWVAERRETLRRWLIQKIEDSKQGVADKMTPPKTLFHSTMEGYTFRFDYEPLGRDNRFSVHTDNNSIGAILAWLTNYDGDYLKQALPFMPNE